MSGISFLKNASLRIKKIYSFSSKNTFDHDKIKKEDDVKMSEKHI